MLFSSPFPRILSIAGRCCAARHIPLLLLSGLCLTVALPVAADIPRAGVKALDLDDPYAAPIAEASQRFGIPAAWIRAIIRAESAGDPHAVSSAGAMGLMQIMPQTWDELCAALALGNDPFVPRNNILAGTAYLRQMYDRYGSPGFLAAYNAGPGRYDEHLAGRPLPAETQAYVAALAPFMRDDVAAPVVVVSLNALPWISAPLFVGRSSTDPMQTVSPSSDTQAIDPQREIFTSAPRSSSLFVARPAPESTR